MTFRRVVALAQALAMIMLLAPWASHVGARPAEAAEESPSPDAMPAPPRALAAAGTGVGCQAGTRRYDGPREPGDPPWPPGARPTPSPQPTVEPSPAAQASASPSPSADPEGVEGDASTALLSTSGVRVAQALPSAQPSSDTAGESTDPAEDADLAPDVSPAPGTAERGFVSGIDVSHHNGDIDFERVRDAGHEFVFVKATQDNDFIDPMFLTNMSRARRAGLAAGGYHFFDYSLDGRVQADHFVDRLELGDAVDGALPPVVDVECWAPIGSSIHAVSAARLRDFVARVYERTGRLPIIYTSVFMWRQVVGDADGFADQPLWAACWGCDAPPSIAPGWDDWHFWQTGIDRIPGVGRLDANVFFGDRLDLQALRLRPVAIAGGAPATARALVELDLGGRDATHLRTSSDGETWSEWRAIRGTPRASLAGGEEGDHVLHVQLRSGPGRVSPVFSDSIALDRTGPLVTALAARLREAPLGDEAGETDDDDPVGVPLEIAWEASDIHAGLTDASIEVACADEEPLRSEAPGSAAPGRTARWVAAAAVPADESCRVTVTGRDGVGNSTRATLDGLLTTSHAIPDGLVDGVEVAGQQLGIVARRGPDMGRASVWLDGVPIGLVDLYQPEPGDPVIVLVTDLPAGGPARVSVEATGTSDPASAGDRVVIDALVTLTSQAASA